LHAFSATQRHSRHRWCAWLSRRWWHTHEGYEGSSSAGESSSLAR
jgi:hypothetical protein